MIKRLFHPFVIGTLAVLMLCAIVWWLAPLLQIGDAHPFDGVALRAGVVALLCLAWAARIAFVVWQRRRTNARLIKGLASGPSASDREAQVLAQRFNEAMVKLRSSTKRSWLQPGSYLYELPWYVFIGAPGSGKTTALLNAGLQFLLTDTASQGAVRGVGGTRNCDWWFTRDAVLIDTAGRYTTQESDASVDASAWGNFLALLKKTRPRQPINGVLLTVNVQDLLQQGAPERADHAARLRARLAELEERLGVRAPVYVLVTKADLIGGFFETFGEMPKEERDQVWGFTSDLAVAGAADPLPEFDAGYRGLELRLGEMLNDRLAAERDPTKRAAQFGFVQEFAALRAPLRDFLNQVFSGGSASHAGPLVRGVYFTSGTQEGTPIDRVMGALSRSFGLTRRSPNAQVGGRGRSFFLSALLHKVIFEERGLVSVNAAAERRRMVWRWSAIGVIGVAAITMLTGWLISYSRNTGYANEVVARVPPLRQTVAGLPTAQVGDVAPLTQPLSDVRDAAAVPAFALDAPPLLHTLGLYQGDKLDAAAKLSYHRLLEHAMLPRVTRRLEERLRAANRDNLEGSYEALKSYLMLYTPDQFDRDTLKAWIGIDWDAQYAASLSPEQRKQLDAHLDALLADGAPAATVPMDKALVASVRDMLVAFPLEYRIYSRLKRQAVGNDTPEFSVARAGGPNAAQVLTRASREPLTRGVPGLYTREGYQRLFQQVPLQKAAVQLATEEPWVLGVKSDPARLRDMALNSTLTNAVRRLYLNDYNKQWDAYLADVRLVKLDSLSRSVEVARMLGGTDSPLSAFLREASAQTTLVPAPTAAPAAVTALADKAKAARDEMSKLAGGQPAGAAATAGADQAIERIVDDHFVALHRLFQGQPAPIEEQQKLFNEAYTQLVAVDAAQKSKSPPPAGGGGDKLKAAAGQQPEMVRAMVEALVDVGAKQGRAAERDVLTSELKPITDFCQRSIANRYPFAAGSRADVLPDDFGQLFGNGGMLDEFYQRRLASLVDTGKPTWVYKPLADGSVPASPAALAEFQRAARIKDAFFRSGGKAPGFRLDIRAAELADGLKELTLDVDGQPLKFVAGSSAAVTVSWPSQRVASEIRVSTVPATSPLSFEGPWALFRLFERFDVQPSDRPEKFSVLLNLDGKRARLDVTANSVLNPFRLREVRQFRCPGAL